MTRAALVPVVDGLFQRASFLTWPAEQKQRVLSEAGVTVVVNLWSKVDPDLSAGRGWKGIYLNWPIAGDRVPKEAAIMVVFIATLIRQGHVVLVHCEAGKNRSVWLAARLAWALGWKDASPLDLASDLGRVNAAFAEDLRKLENK